MMGKHSGVGVRMKQNISPHMVHVHCVAHRVVLASSHAAKAMENINDYRHTVNAMYNFYKYSASQYQRLRELSQALDNEDFQSLRAPCSVRWLSISRAVKAIHANLPSLILELGKEAARNNATAIGLLRRVKTFQFVVTTHMLMDILPVMDKLSTNFQRDNVNLGSIKPLRNGTKSILHHFTENNFSGEREQKFYDDFVREDRHFRGHFLNYSGINNVNAFNASRREFLNHLIDNLTDRFPQNDLDVVNSLSMIFSISQFPE